MNGFRFGCLAALMIAVTGGVSAAPLVVLPLEDRTGLPGVAATVESEIRLKLSETEDLLAEAPVRDAMRRLRVRNTGSLSPERLERLGTELGSTRFFSATLHLANEAPVTEVILSARLMRAGDPVLEWAGFEAVSGLDDAHWFGRGRVDDLETLGRRVGRALVESLEAGEHVAPDGRWHVRHVYLRHPADLDGPGVVAVIPFDAAGKQLIAGRLMTDLAEAVLFRRGMPVVSPGLVDHLTRQRGVQPRGEIDAETRVALSLVTGADTIFTGTVVTDGVRPQGQEAEPRIGLSARLLDARTGKILWSGELDASGWDHPGWFRQGRVFSEGGLADAMMSALVRSFAGPAR